MERGDNVLAGASLAVALLAGLAGLVLLFTTVRLLGYFEVSGAPKEHESAAAAVIFGVAVFCFFEAYRFYRFFASPQIRDRYYARTGRREEVTKSKG
ncbi:MAG: hypothetical protein WBQ08_21875 [Candidatus Sulfotelmatobacter sp.]